jgi:MFS family permease
MRSCRTKGLKQLAYASASGLSTSQGTLILSILNVAQIIGQLGTGFVSDRFDPILPMVGSTLCSAVIVLCVWGFSTSFAPLLIFGFTYGLFAGGYSVLYCRFATTLTDQRASGLWLYSIFEFQRGAGNIIGGPVSGLLTNTSLVATGYGVVKYERLVLFVGIAFLIGSLGGIGWFSKGRKQIPR